MDAGVPTRAGHGDNQPLFDAVARGAVCARSGRGLTEAQRRSVCDVLTRFPVPLLPRDVGRLALTDACAAAVAAWVEATPDRDDPRPVPSQAIEHVRTPELRRTAPAPVHRPTPRDLARDDEAVDARLVLLVDTREVRTKTDRTFVESRLLEAGVGVEVRQLPLGDFLWVVRGVPAAPPAAGGTAAAPWELVTSVVVERKRADDLAASIVDGRYHEQKARLAACPCAKPVLLVEGALGRQDVMSAEALRSALRTSLVASGMHAVTTGSTDDTVAWLAATHRSLARRLGLGPAGRGASTAARLRSTGATAGVTYAAFAAASRKSQPLAVLSAHGRMLRHVPGMSAARAQSLLERHPTPASLFRALRADPAGEEKAIASLAATGQTRAFGAACASKLARVMLHKP